MKPVSIPEGLADAFARLSQTAEDYNSFVGKQTGSSMTVSPG